ncbi:MAG: hypothetical protein KA781_01380 [Aquabacterium sp.]|nr:hypothetical protein [Aquabacterium sp.]MBP8190344.1 hypothetical protein [Aquabacterium sp.]
MDNPNMPSQMANPMGAKMGGGQMESEGGYCIEIYAHPDGTFKVTREDKPEPMEGMEGESQGQPANSLDEALEIARGMAAGPQESPEDAAQRGYSKVKRPEMAKGMNAGALFGE